ncbi:hypothetical protein METBIDRAFT_78147 [Metschnikowia bicuspidata var. bicuspidata NRRL YB-4993]|uniref:Transcriptional coactivator HFI1/ADA1 n=1 Tax=Metschnikowia bicuspidata var. bicuspidata NRRL YB-4993 TaxID=869754 RepID=A0A1A0HAB3_9ASCO|nr:hypothetical protein METBIDRAFT_78147 [Metschnikowia bicuspidata var. bicuspidata NRRL YB-4993]OBA21069.1 hypothetical protein METBIDRAFT_78147 [Metschnikowia bicuspidata var. bicuspidata NRRL YB-4993]
MSSVAAPSPVAASQPAKTNKRLQLEAVMREFQSKLGPDWETYHEALSAFLIGRLSRAELVARVGPLMKAGLLKYHNKLLLLNFAHSLQDGAQEYLSELASFWNKRNAKARGVKLSQYEKFKQNIMGLPLKERRRIRAITKDAGKRDRLGASVTLTRQALLPKIPMILDKEQQQLQVNNLVQWQQDVVNGINTPLASASHELPDTDTLSRKVLMTSREHGLTGGIGARVFEVISLGLETHLKNIVECAVDSVRYRKRKYESSAFLQPGFLQGGAGDMYNTLEMFPHLAEPGGPQARLCSIMLQNDDLIDHAGPGYELPPRPALAAPKAAPSAPESAGPKRPALDPENGPAAQGNGVVPNGGSGAPPPKEVSHVGTPDELKWLLHDLIRSST